jgi:hypothetical protein
LRRPTSKPRRALLAVSLVALSALGIAACGGDDGGGDEDPQQLLEQTFNNDQKIESGAFELSFEVAAEGGDDAGELKASIGGPFQSGGEGAFPSFDVDGEVDLSSASQDFSGSAGITSTGDKAFVNFQDTDYEVPAQLFDQFSQSFLQAQQQTSQEGGESSFAALGVDPTNWLTDLDNEGDSDVEGTETVHISGTADVPKLVEDIKQIAEKVPQAAGQVTGEDLSQLDELTGIVENADFDIYTGADDDLLRKIEANLTLNPPDVGGAPESVDVNFALTLSDIGDPQEIAAPSGAQPLGDLLGQFGLDENSLNQVEGALDGAAGGGDGSLPQAGGSPTAPSNSASQAYLDCLAKAEGAAALQECSALLEQGQ